MIRILRDWINDFIIGPFKGKRAFQRTFELMYLASLQGMNYGRGGDEKFSGERHAIRYVKAKLEKSGVTHPILFDVGAHAGRYAQMLLDEFDNQAVRIHCFEPAKEAFAKLSENFQHPNIELHPFGMGDIAQQQSLFSPKGSPTLASLLNRKLDHFELGQTQIEEVSIRTIDDFCRESQIEKIHLLKIDIEGAELLALKGAENFLKKGEIDFIQFEFGGGNIDSRTFFQDFWYLLSPNYHIYRMVSNGLHPIQRYKESLEVFSTINFLAEKKRHS